MRRSENPEEQNPFDPDPTLSSSDPLNVARGEGLFFRRGLRGTYRKNFFTKFGFIVLGCFSISFAVSFFAFAVSWPTATGADYIIRLVYSFLALGFLYLGVQFIKTALRK